MSPRQLLEKLENLGIIDAAILERVRKEVENTDKHVKPKAILKYLVKKNQITEKQAAAILQQKVPKTEDEMEVVQPTERSYDTDDLTGIVNDPTPEPDPKPKSKPPKKSDHGATRVDDRDLAVEVEPEVIVSEIYDPVDLGQPAGNQPAYGGLDDLGGGLDAGADGGYESGAYNTQSGENPVKPTFAGKRDKKDQWSTKWLYIGFGIFGVILIATAVSWYAVMGQKPEDMFQAAMDSYNKQTWTDAAKKFEEYLDQFPNEKDAATARARRIHSIIRGTYSTRNWPVTIQQADSLLPELLEEEDGKIDLLRDDLAVMLPHSLAEISDKAKRNTDLPAMEKSLAEILELKTVIDNPTYIPPSKPKSSTIVADYFSEVENNVKTLQGLINKEKRYDADLVKIQDLGKSGETNQAFGIYQQLTRSYGDLASRGALRKIMVEISEKEQELVKPVTLDLKISQADRPSLIENTVVLAATTGDPVDALKGEIINFMAEGSVYGIDAGTGAIVWRRFVGFETTNRPQDIDDEHLLISDQSNQELIAVKKESGQIIWRCEIDQPFMPPAIGDQMIVVTTRSGIVIQLNPISGAVEHSVQLPQSAAVSAVISVQDPYIYQVGQHANLYVLSKQDFSCKEVYYLGIQEGSIVVPPQIWTGYILIAVNGGDYCDLLVLKPENNGVGMKLVQTIRRVTDGPISNPLQRFNRWMLMTSDNGSMKILELSASDDFKIPPVREFAGDRYDAKGGEQAFTLSEGSNLWIAGQAIIRYRIQRGQGEFRRELIEEPNDTFLTPMHKLDDYLLHVRRRNDSGMISASLVNAMDLKQVWRTDLGGELAGGPLQFGDNKVVVSNQGDMFVIDGDAEQNRYTNQAVRASTIVENLKFNNVVRLNNETFAATGPVDRADLLFANGANGQSKLLTLSEPANKPSGRPITIGEHLIIPSSSGQVVRIDPKNGRMVGTPFQPPVIPGSITPWFEPTKLSETTFAVAAGVSDKGGPSTLYVLNAENVRNIQQLASLESEAPFRSRLVNDGNQIFAVVKDNGDDKLVAITTAEPLTRQKEAILPGMLVAGPWLEDGQITVQLDDDKLYCYGTDLAEKWSVKVPNDKFACPPTTIGTKLMLTFQSGKVLLVDPGTGETSQEFSVGQPIVHTPLHDGQKLYFSGADGTVHVVDVTKIGSQ